jgi:RNA polymerase sigma factor (sigma-70 family)
MSTKSFTTSSLLTRPSLLFRLRDWDDHTSWVEFYHLYRRLVYGLARRSGLTSSEAEDVVQEVFRHVAERIHEFEARPNRGAFRRWLMNQTRWRISDKFRERIRVAIPDPRSPNLWPAVEEIAAPTEDQDQAWEAEWQRHVFDVAMDRMARRVPPKHFQAFDLSARQGWPANKVAKELGLHTAAVYIHNHRLTKLLRREVEKLRRTLE